MAITFNPSDSPITRGIKTVGVGKKGSRSLPQELAREILADLKAGKVPPAAQGAFFAGLFFKGIELEEICLDQYFDEQATILNADLLAQALTKDAPPLIQWICEQILRKKTLDKDTAYTLGTFLMSNEPGDAARGLIASALRVRYETDDEYEGLLKAIEDTIVPEFRTPAPAGLPIIQLAEPFDGNDHSYMITPLLGRYLQTIKYRAVYLVGRNSGPKFEFNLADVTEALGVPWTVHSSHIANSKTPFGSFIHQRDLSPAADRWVDIRRQTVKRPFMATLEKFLNPLNAQIIAVSAFHPPYGEKMMTIAERAGFPGIIVIRNGVEGSLAFPLKREVRILCSARQEDGSYRRHEIIFEPEKFLYETVDVEEKIEHPTALDNARLIEQYISRGSTENRHFDLRVRATCEGFRMAIAWLCKDGCPHPSESPRP
jgi:anthranilate phosphoribosyltransferase